MRHVISATPVVAGGALVIPAGLLAQRRGDTRWAVDAMARARIEQLAMEKVMAAERALGHEVIDVSAQKCGWDVTSMPRAIDGRLAPTRHLAVKGRARFPPGEAYTARTASRQWRQAASTSASESAPNFSRKARVSSSATIASPTTLAAGTEVTSERW